MSKLWARPATLAGWGLGTIGWGLGGVVSFVPVFFVVAVLQKMLRLHEDTVEVLLALWAVGVHLLLWWQVLLGWVMIVQSLDREELGDAMGALVWLFLLVGFQFFCLVLALEIQESSRHQGVWYT
jgi:hypothetical protein